MKLIKALFAGAAALCLFSACNKLEMKKFAPETQYVAPTLTAPTAINLTADVLAQNSKVTFTWSAADFGQNAEILYNINASYNGGNYIVLLARLTGTQYGIDAQELGDKLLGMGIPKGTQVSLKLNIDCSVGSNFTTLKSADKTVTVYVD